MGESESNVIPISRQLSPTYDKLEKFEDGEKQVIGSRGGLLNRSFSRYMKGIREAVEAGLTRIEGYFGLQFVQSPPRKDVSITKSDDGKVIGLNISVADEQYSIWQRCRLLGSTIIGAAYSERHIIWDEVKQVLRSAGVPGFNPGELRGVWRPGMTEHPILVLPHRHQDGQPLKGNWSFPSARFMDLARDAMRLQVEDPQMADTCMTGLTEEFVRQASHKNGATLFLHGIEMNVGAGTYTVMVRNRDEKNPWRTVAVERKGVLLEIDPEACAIIRGSVDTLSPYPA